MGRRTLPSVVITAGLRPKSAMKFGHNKLLSLHGMCGHAVFSLIMLNKSCPGSSPQVSASGTVPACAAVVELRDPKPSASDTSLVSKQSVALAGSSCWHPPAHSSVLSCPLTRLGQRNLTLASSQPHSGRKSHEAVLIQKNGVKFKSHDERTLSFHLSGSCTH